MSFLTVCVIENTTAEEIKCGSAVSHPFEELDSRDRSFDKVATGQFGQITYARVEHIARKPVVSFSGGLSIEASLFHAQGVHAIDLAQILTPCASAISGQLVTVRRGRLCFLTGDNPHLGHRFETSFGSCAAGFYHQLQVFTDSGDMLQLSNLTELIHLPNGADGDVDAYPGARVLWRRSPTKGGYTGAGYHTELSAFKARAAGIDVPRLAELEDLLPVYEAFDTLLTSRGLTWMT